MGRTNPTYRDALSAIEDRWAPYRRALRRRDRERFDRLFGYAREHADAAGARNHRNPLVAALVGIALEQERRHDEAASAREGLADEHAAVADRLDRFDSRLDRLDAHLECLDSRLDRLEARLDDVEAVADAAALDAAVDDDALAARLADLDDAPCADADGNRPDDAPCDDADGDRPDDAPGGQ